MVQDMSEYDRNNPPGLSKSLARQVMCGLCKFKCCNSPSMHVELTEEESKRLSEPLRWDIGGHCRCLTDTGCKYGQGRPVFCKLFPLQVQKGRLKLSFWSIMHCPTPDMYEFFGMQDGKYVYKRVGKAARSRINNSHDNLILDCRLEDFPTTFSTNRESLVLLFGEEVVKSWESFMERKRKFEEIGFQ